MKSHHQEKKVYILTYIRNANFALIDLKILVPLYFCRLISINMIPASFSENLLVRFGTQILPHPFNSWVMAFEPFPKSAGKGRLDAKWMDGWMELRRPKHTALACQMSDGWSAEGTKDKEKKPAGPPTMSWGPEGLQTSCLYIFQRQTASNQTFSVPLIECYSNVSKRRYSTTAKNKFEQ